MSVENERLLDNTGWRILEELQGNARFTQRTRRGPSSEQSHYVQPCASSCRWDTASALSKS
jgi:hypothetical protein